MQQLIIGLKAASSTNWFKHLAMDIDESAYKICYYESVLRVETKGVE